MLGPCFKTSVNNAPLFRIPLVTSSYHYQIVQKRYTHDIELIDNVNYQ